MESAGYKISEEEKIGITFAEAIHVMRLKLFRAALNGVLASDEGILKWDGVFNNLDGIVKGQLKRISVTEVEHVIGLKEHEDEMNDMQRENITLKKVVTSQKNQIIILMGYKDFVSSLVNKLHSIFKQNKETLQGLREGKENREEILSDFERANNDLNQYIKTMENENSNLDGKVKKFEIEEG